MAIRASKQHQVRDVTEGLALGVLAQGVTAVISGPAIKFAFDYAWRNWLQSRHFPSIAGTFPSREFSVGLSKSERRRGFAYAEWATEGRWWVPQQRPMCADWPLEECLEAFVEGDGSADGRVSIEDWKQLGALFVSHLKPHEIQHAD